MTQTSLSIHKGLSVKDKELLESGMLGNCLWCAAARIPSFVLFFVRDHPERLRCVAYPRETGFLHTVDCPFRKARTGFAVGVADVMEHPAPVLQHAKRLFVKCCGIQLPG